MTIHTLHLMIPGLLGPWPSMLRQDIASSLQLPALTRLLSRASTVTDVVPQHGLEASLCGLFGLYAKPNRDLPIAALTRLADGGTPDRFWWLRADPIHLRADLQKVLLFDARIMDVSALEAERLAADFNRHLGNNGWYLEALNPRRWYLRLDTDPGVQTTPLPELIGKDITASLPSGDSAPLWHALLTEVQMLFHASEVNAERDWEEQQMPINSVWFWGGGRLPRVANLTRPAAGIYGDDPLTRGLARHLNSPVNALPGDATGWRESALLDQGTDSAPDLGLPSAADSAAAASSLVVLETVRYYVFSDDYYRWNDCLARLERDWFTPCLSLLSDGRLGALRLYPCDGRVFEISRQSLNRLRFWHRDKPLANAIGAAGHGPAAAL